VSVLDFLSEPALLELALSEPALGRMLDLTLEYVSDLVLVDPMKVACHSKYYQFHNIPTVNNINQWDMNRHFRMHQIHYL